MKCQEIETRLIEYMDGALTPAERRAVDLHAQACAACAQRIHGFADVSGLLDSWEPIEVSASFNAELQRRLREEPVAPFRSRLWNAVVPTLNALPLGRPAFAMALLILVSVAAIVMRYTPAEQEQIAMQQAPDITVIQAVSDSGVDDISLYRNMAMLEDMDVLRNFEVLQVLSENNNQ